MLWLTDGKWQTEFGSTDVGFWIQTFLPSSVVSFGMSAKDILGPFLMRAKQTTETLQHSIIEFQNWKGCSRLRNLKVLEYFGSSRISSCFSQKIYTAQIHKILHINL
jgi:hypothetical protein